MILSLEKHKGLLKYRDWCLTKLSKIYNLLQKDSIFREDWKNCIILDACRYDKFKKANQIDGKLHKIYSVATHTIPFCSKTFTKKKYDDIVCLSANPHVDRTLGHKFHKCIPVWDGAITNGTTLPESFIKPVLEATIKYPNKKLLIWFVQPHTPYIGYKYPQPYGTIYGMQTRRFFKHFQLFFWSHLSKKQLNKRYMRNLVEVLVVCEKLLKILHGKTVITSDHGECLGERIPLTPIKIYGHYEDIHSLKMYEVPYFIVKEKKNKI